MRDIEQPSSFNHAAHEPALTNCRWSDCFQTISLLLRAGLQPHMPEPYSPALQGFPEKDSGCHIRPMTSHALKLHALTQWCTQRTEPARPSYSSFERLPFARMSCFQCSANEYPVHIKWWMNEWNFWVGETADSAKWLCSPQQHEVLNLIFRTHVKI